LQLRTDRLRDGGQLLADGSHGSGIGLADLSGQGAERADDPRSLARGLLDGGRLGERIAALDYGGLGGSPVRGFGHPPPIRADDVVVLVLEVAVPLPRGVTRGDELLYSLRQVLRGREP